jgi:hypothetical protein
VAQVENAGVAAEAGLDVPGGVAANERAVLGEREDRGVDDSPFGVEHRQMQSVVLVDTDSARELNPQAQRRVGQWGGVVGIADDGAVGEGQGEVLGEELLGVQGQDEPPGVRTDG